MQIDLLAVPGPWQDVNVLNDLVYPPEIAAAWTGRDIKWSAAEWRVLVRDERARLVVHVGLRLRKGSLDGAPVFIGGVGGVMSHPEMRGRGFARQAMERARQFFRDEGVDFAHLFCDAKVGGFYAKLGWQPFSGPVMIEQPTGRVPFLLSGSMVQEVGRPAPRAGCLDLLGLPW